MSSVDFLLENSTSKFSYSLDFSILYFKQAAALLSVTFVVTNHMPLGAYNSELTEDYSAAVSY